MKQVGSAVCSLFIHCEQSCAIPMIVRNEGMTESRSKQRESSTPQHEAAIRREALVSEDQDRVSTDRNSC